MAPNQYTPPVQRASTDLTTVLQRMIQASGQDVDRLPVPNSDRINAEINHGIQDPENMLQKFEYLYKPGPEDYPEPNEG